MASLRRILLIVSILGSVFFLFYRFLNPGETVFISDEPMTQINLDTHLKNGSLPFTGLRGSSIPLAYGAAAMWVYALFRLITDTVAGTAFLHILMYSLGLFLLYPAIRKRVSAESAFLVMWLLLSSPMLFLLTRHPWDNTFQVLPAGGILLLLASMESRRYLELKFALLGIVSAFLMNVHLMPGPLVLAAGFALLPLLKNHSWLGRAKLFLWGFLPFCLVLAPYLYEALRLYYSESVAANTKTHSAWGDARNLWWLLQRSLMYLSHWGVKGQFGSVFPSFLEFSGFPLATFFRYDLFGWFPKFAALLYLLLLPFRWKKGIGIVERFSFLSFFLILFVFNLLNIPTEPHYFQPIWWLPFVALAFALDSAPGKLKPILYSLSFCAAIANSAYTIQMQRYVSVNKGMRNMTFSTVVSEQQRVFDEICRATPITEVALIYIGSVQMVQQPAEYFQNHLESCKGKQLRVVAQKKDAIWELKYPGGSESDAALIAEKINGQSGR